MFSVVLIIVGLLFLALAIIRMTAPSRLTAEEARRITKGAHRVTKVMAVMSVIVVIAGGVMMLNPDFLNFGDGNEPVEEPQLANVQQYNFNKEELDKFALEFFGAAAGENATPEEIQAKVDEITKTVDDVIFPAESEARATENPKAVDFLGEKRIHDWFGLRNSHYEMMPTLISQKTGEDWQKMLDEYNLEDRISLYQRIITIKALVAAFSEMGQIDANYETVAKVRNYFYDISQKTEGDKIGNMNCLNLTLSGATLSEEYKYHALSVLEVFSSFEFYDATKVTSKWFWKAENPGSDEFLDVVKVDDPKQQRTGHATIFVARDVNGDILYSIGIFTSDGTIFIPDLNSIKKNFTIPRGSQPNPNPTPVSDNKPTPQTATYNVRAHYVLYEADGKTLANMTPPADEILRSGLKVGDSYSISQFRNITGFHLKNDQTISGYLETAKDLTIMLVYIRDSSPTADVIVYLRDYDSHKSIGDGSKTFSQEIGKSIEHDVPYVSGYEAYSIQRNSDNVESVGFVNSTKDRYRLNVSNSSSKAQVIIYYKKVDEQVRLRYHAYDVNVSPKKDLTDPILSNDYMTASTTKRVSNPFASSLTALKNYNVVDSYVTVTVPANARGTYDVWFGYEKKATEYYPVYAKCVDYKGNVIGNRGKIYLEDLPVGSTKTYDENDVNDIAGWEKRGNQSQEPKMINGVGWVTIEFFQPDGNENKDHNTEPTQNGGKAPDIYQPDSREPSDGDGDGQPTKVAPVSTDEQKGNETLANHDPNRDENQLMAGSDERQQDADENDTVVNVADAINEGDKGHEGQSSGTGGINQNIVSEDGSVTVDNGNAPPTEDTKDSDMSQNSYDTSDNLVSDTTPDGELAAP